MFPHRDVSSAATPAGKPVTTLRNQFELPTSSLRVPQNGFDDLDRPSRWVFAALNLTAAAATQPLARARAAPDLNGVPNVVLERRAWPAFWTSFSTAAAASMRCRIICCCL